MIDFSKLEMTASMITTLIGAVTILGGAVWQFHQRVVKPVVSMVKRLMSAVETIEAEFKPSDGLTLRDALDRAETTNRFQNAMLMAMFRFDPRGMYKTDAKG